MTDRLISEDGNWEWSPTLNTWLPTEQGREAMKEEGTLGPVFLPDGPAAPEPEEDKPWYKQKQAIAAGVIVLVVGLIGIGFAAGNGEYDTPNETAKVITQDDEAPAPAPSKSKSAPPAAVGYPECKDFMEDRVLNGLDVASEHLDEGQSILGSDDIDYIVSEAPGMAGGWQGISLGWGLIADESEEACAGAPGQANITQSIRLMEESAQAWADSWLAVSVLDTSEAVDLAEEAARLSEEANDEIDKALDAVS